MYSFNSHYSSEIFQGAFYCVQVIEHTTFSSLSTSKDHLLLITKLRSTLKMGLGLHSKLQVEKPDK